MASSDAKSISTTPPASSSAQGTETYRTKSVATRLTEAEFAEVESAATSAGQKVSEWLRDAALEQARAGQDLTDSILLAELLGMRGLMVNLFAKASQGPLSVEDIRKMSAHAESIKEQKAAELLAQKRLKCSPERGRNTP